MASQKPIRSVMGFVWLIVISASVAAGIVAAGQSEKTKARGEQKSGKPANPRFTCPDPLAAQACKSFEELYAAHDETVLSQLPPPDFEYVCFRREADEFFIVRVSGPLELGDEAAHPRIGEKTGSGIGEITAFADGVQDTSAVPSVVFVGDWKRSLGGSDFSATHINRQAISDPARYGVSLDSDQFSCAYGYKNLSGEDVDYTLTVQRSTGRFTETFTVSPSKIPLRREQGRCSPLPVARPERSPSSH